MAELDEEKISSEISSEDQASICAPLNLNDKTEYMNEASPVFASPSDTSSYGQEEVSSRTMTKKAQGPFFQILEKINTDKNLRGFIYGISVCLVFFVCVSLISGKSVSPFFRENTYSYDMLSFSSSRVFEESYKDGMKLLKDKDGKFTVIIGYLDSSDVDSLSTEAMLMGMKKTNSNLSDIDKIADGLYCQRGLVSAGEYHYFIYDSKRNKGGGIHILCTPASDPSIQKEFESLYKSVRYDGIKMY